MIQSQLLNTAMTMQKKKRKPFQPQTQVRSLTGGERERSKDHIRWILALSRNDTDTIYQRLSENPSLALISCHYTGLSPIHWAVKNNNRSLVKKLVTDYNVSPDIYSRSGSSPLHLAAIYGRREIYNDLIHLLGANPKVVDFSGQRAEAYIDDLGHGSNNKGINKIWQDLAMDIQTFQRKCFKDQEQRNREQRNGKDPKCFEGMKKRHSIAF